MPCPIAHEPCGRGPAAALPADLDAEALRRRKRLVEFVAVDRRCLFTRPRGLSDAGEEAVRPARCEHEQQPGGVRPDVAEAVDGTAGNEDGVARPGRERPVTVEHLQPPGEDVEGLFLPGAHVRRRPVPGRYGAFGECRTAARGLGRRLDRAGVAHGLEGQSLTSRYVPYALGCGRRGKEGRSRSCRSPLRPLDSSISRYSGACAGPPHDDMAPAAGL